MGGDEAAGGLHAADPGHADVHEDEVGTLDREPGEHLFTAAGRSDALDAGDGADGTTHGLAGQWCVVADENGGHGGADVLPVGAAAWGAATFTGLFGMLGTGLQSGPF